MYYRWKTEIEREKVPKKKYDCHREKINYYQRQRGGISFKKRKINKKNTDRRVPIRDG